ncbi:MAG: ATPase, T2SS/T4P/T4SS family [Akkermansia muciniphila]
MEDPVEYELSGINQVMVKADIGMTFAAALRAMLRPRAGWGCLRFSKSTTRCAA